MFTNIIQELHLILTSLKQLSSMIYHMDILIQLILIYFIIMIVFGLRIKADYINILQTLLFLKNIYHSETIQEKLQYLYLILQTLLYNLKQHIIQKSIQIIQVQQIIIFDFFPRNYQELIGSFHTIQSNQSVTVKANYFEHRLQYENGTKIIKEYGDQQQATYFISNQTQNINIFVKRTYQNSSNNNSLIVQSIKNCKTIPNSQYSINQKSCSCNSYYNIVYLKDGSNVCLYYTKTIQNNVTLQYTRNCQIIQNSFGILQQDSNLDCKCKIGYKWAISDETCVIDQIQKNQLLKIVLGTVITFIAIIIITIIVILILCYRKRLRWVKASNKEAYNQDPSFSLNKIDSNAMIKINYQNQSQNILCSICLGSQKPFMKLNCNNYFHQKCIRQWGQKKNQCPNCKRELNLQNKQKREMRRQIDM